MLLATFVGFLFILAWFIDHHRTMTWDQTSAVLRGVTMVIFFCFWLFFPIVYFAYIRKSAATLEYQRVVREGEEEMARRVTAHARALPRRTAPRSPPG